MNKPLIGITLDSEQPGGYSKFAWYAVRENYCDSVADAGGIPVPLPHQPEIANSYLDMIDGLVITGGAFDVDPTLFGDTTRHETVVTKDRRTAFELAVTKGAIHRDMPILGICGGQQLLNVVLGGTLIQHIPDEIENSLAHEQPNPRDEPGHDIAVKTNTLLHQITGTETMSVNSAHHQAVKTIAGPVTINATAPDGVIEGIELQSKRFCLGVQWHPEFSIDPGDKRIFAAFIDAAT
ncbi:MAG: gamma-glutamyl-gamma-aminobutyrate hydrolase family protein [Alphaproteobacteria bacterium]|jgi:putative glutamine amidotransferase